MHLLGHSLPDTSLVRIALNRFYGIRYHMADRLIARLQIHPEALVSDLTEPQITALSAYLSSPSNSTRPSPTPLSVPSPPPKALQKPTITTSVEGDGRMAKKELEDPLDNLMIETDRKRQMLEAIQHQRLIGSYKGKRIAQGFPVNGQRTKTNARTALKFNRIDRKMYTTTTSLSTLTSSSYTSGQSQFSPLSSSKIMAALRSIP